MLSCLKNRTALESLKGQLVLCDTKTDGGGWIIIQRRIKGDVEFANKTWAQYRDGFGSFDGDLWIGNAVIRKLTVAGYTDMRVDMKWKGHTYYATYKNYKVEDEANFYRLTYNGFRGSTRLDDMMGSIGMPFSTVDVRSIRCTLWYGRTGWWWRTLDRWCGSVNLNGIWAETAYGQESTGTPLPM
ncbi:ficolin-1-like [Physella acuta]|uniref:ficolin-1-like n=1 Tax=Physella acuta TaxID=109671 RepID=UPI0027DC4A3E|nr:ficolin-1-like [Physella acuta]